MLYGSTSNWDNFWWVTDFFFGGGGLCEKIKNPANREKLLISKNWNKIWVNEYLQPSFGLPIKNF
jgi:hypothetical protein